MKFVSRTFLRGLILLLPLILTIWPIYYFFHSMDAMVKRLVVAGWPNADYVPGLGIVLGVVTIFLLGLLMSSEFMQRVYRMLETPFRKLPLVRTLYTAIKELTRYIAPEETDHTKNVVVVRVPGIDAELVGFVMRENLDDLPQGPTKEHRVAVYLPMSYQIGGFTVFVPREWLVPMDTTVEDAMRGVLTGWMTQPDGG